VSNDLRDFPRYCLPNVLARTDPAGVPLPLVVSSPHSGRAYPPDFEHAAPYERVRLNEDAYVDQLVDEAPRLGATLLCAEFPRSYIDPNRSPADIDESILAEPWPGEVQSSYRGANYGIGLVRRWAEPGLAMYDRPLSIAEMQQRIAAYYEPYHRIYKASLMALHRRYGVVYALDMHSYGGKDPWQPSAADVPGMDFVLSDGDGKTADAGFFAHIAQALQATGRSFAANSPFKGGFVTQGYGDPARGIHVLQIEINRMQYLEPGTADKSAGFGELRTALTGVLQAAADYARQAVEPR
jgi:N-formylglutamate deformylase